MLELCVLFVEEDRLPLLGKLKILGTLYRRFAEESRWIRCLEASLGVERGKRMKSADEANLTERCSSSNE